MNEQNEKQAIEEMRELIHAEIKKAVDSGLITWTEFAQHLTERLTEQGYRKQEWISVEERLPEKDGKYLICTINGYVTFGYFIDRGDDNLTLLHDNPHFDYRNVVYWMPLPEPPKMKGGAE